MSDRHFPERIETDRLRLERVSPETTDVNEVLDLATTESWQNEVTEHMPWYGFESRDHVTDYVDHCEQQWTDREKASYTIRPAEGEPNAGELVGFAGYTPSWGERVAGAGIVLAEHVWGRGYGGERAAAFVELAFERHDMAAYATTVADVNERSRRMIEKYVERFGGKHEGHLRRYKSRTGGEAIDYHRYSIVREEYERATKAETSSST